MEGKVDRRVRKTKKQLRQGLAELLAKKPVKSITVREIAELVDINRGTFYLHYKDIYDMVSKIQDEMFDEFNEIIDAHLLNDSNKSPLPMLVSVFEYLADNAEMAYALMSKNGDAFFVDHLKGVIKSKCFMNISKIYNIRNDAKFEYFYSFIVSGCIGIFQKWLEGGLAESSEEMAALAEKLIMQSITALK